MLIVFKKIKKEFIKNKLLLKSQQRFKSQKHNIFTEEIRKVALSSNDDKRCNQLIQWKPTHME